MNNLFRIAESCLFDARIEQKLAITHHAGTLLAEKNLSLQDSGPILPIADTVFPVRPLLMMPRDMPRRRLNSDAGKAAFFHALAHIEFVAIYLAWDIIYRFRGLPDDFYHDWLCIAVEEALHFELIRQRLQTLGVDYGDLPAHSGLWLHAVDTAADVLARLAVVPRGMEARGLDVTPVMIEKLRLAGDGAGVAVLERIYQDEVGHVERGSYWFNFLAQQQRFDPEQKYKELILEYFKVKPKGPFNREMRIIAGFSHNEIDWLEECWHE
jgi:uncharacterized ferritin-like protein (DUF455 family)